MLVSVVIRTLNEAKHLPALLQSIAKQSLDGHECEVVLVDSGSTDATLQIAQQHGCRIVHIKKEDFSFGRSLNVGCEAAKGDALIFVSGHCIPFDEHWIARLVAPLGKQGVVYSYGGQVGDSSTHFSERQIFAKYFPPQSKVPQDGFYCNNANSALLRSDWSVFKFDEEITGLEDMHLAKALVQRGRKVAYVADAKVYHLHDETWRQVRRRFEREAIALQRIMPEVQLGALDVARYAASAILLDWGAALQERTLRLHFTDIIAYRLCQFWGAYKGNHVHRQLSRAAKERYYFPR
ncbi:MAG: glycosyltransferase [Aquincola sp.]|nr:glycosyltransferase [Aquincola sp.]|tara:strand:+ start:5569 stop:6450 length:882 start_codon:yes stop_codon:yes gene_type:complete